MEEEEMLKRITRFLEQGGTMLATHHICGAPEFRYRGQVVCPVCSFGDGSAAEDSASEKKEATPEPGRSGGAQERKMLEEVLEEKAVPRAGTAEREGTSIEEADLRRVVLCKLKELADGIESEQDLDKLRKQFDCVEAALKALRSMER